MAAQGFHHLIASVSDVFMLTNSNLFGRGSKSAAGSLVMRVSLWCRAPSESGLGRTDPFNTHSAIEEAGEIPWHGEWKMRGWQDERLGSHAIGARSTKSMGKVDVMLSNVNCGTATLAPVGWLGGLCRSDANSLAKS